MPEAFNEVVILRDGDPEGNRMVVKLTTEKGVEIFAIAVPQDWPSRTGPTWTYLFENDGLTLIDVGATGSTRALVEGIECAGFKANDIERVIITHGHADHDGGVKQFAEETGAEVWAHDIYAYLLPYNPWEIQRRPASVVQQEMHRIAEAQDLYGRGSDSNLDGAVSVFDHCAVDQHAFVRRQSENKPTHALPSPRKPRMTVMLMSISESVLAVPAMTA